MRRLLRMLLSRIWGQKPRPLAPSIAEARAGQAKALRAIDEEVVRLHETGRRTTEAAAQAAQVVARGWGR